MLFEPNPIQVIGGLLEVYVRMPWEENANGQYLLIPDDAEKIFILPQRIVTAMDFFVSDICKDFQGNTVKRECCELRVSYNETFYYLPYHWKEIARAIDNAKKES